jgi:hypothetical protein
VDINANELFASFFVCSVGLVAFMYGKRQGRVPQMIGGLVLLVFPYFVSNLLLMFGIAVAVLGAMWGALRLGW